ncbi:hypothetical protein K505DRAFT_418407 [Melanomma pulvis-pyrius CBS 109.77]|uniref:Uncharacterized protein n=1 Tax=Melanomma pulvis-pyrius CBS 109.77 TaxID=1314802 RepID=A0A6A6X842_9PLEO|nr:hypothetical protein K505DRAFT_418407 [Melanomma pulvis-pyrius CBS 109.77]
MTSTVGDYLFAKLAEHGVRRVLGPRGGTLFIGSIQRNNLQYSDITLPSRNSNCYEVGAFVISSQAEDLSESYNGGSLIFPWAPVVYVVEHGSAQFQDLSSITSKHHFAATTILNSPSTASSQIDRVIRVMLRERKPVYIGLSLAVAGQVMPAAKGSLQSTQQPVYHGDSAEEGCADAAVAMSFI